MVTDLKYLGRVLNTLGDNWPEVVGNIWKAGSRWSQLSVILG